MDLEKYTLDHSWTHNLRCLLCIEYIEGKLNEYWTSLCAVKVKLNEFLCSVSAKFVACFDKKRASLQV